MATRASRTDVRRMRLSCQGLSGPGLPNPGAVLRRMLALQAQDYRTGLGVIGVRSPGLSVKDVEQAIDSAEIVRSWPLRGTLHLVAAPDLRGLPGLTAPRVLAGMRTRRAQLGLDEAAIEGAREVALESLSGGRELTRAGFLAELEVHGMSTAGQRGYHLIANLALTGTLCWGRHAGGLQVARPHVSEIDVDGVTHYLAPSAETGLPGSAPRQRAGFARAIDDYARFSGRPVTVRADPGASGPVLPVP
ncbi:MAG: winged helix DNA-binding domain-containing protein [Ramlibacter sp.]|nr:winged helix DNA-binding domain-containing protein [Cryobacterium sp.]